MARPSGPAAGQSDTTILVVDDEPSLLALVRTMLWRAGYAVLEASSAEEALHLCAQHPQPIQLLLTDVLMPQMNGYELAENLKASRPDLKVLYMSGFQDKVLVESTGRPLGKAPLIRKPFTAYNLIAKISDLLGEHSVTQA